VRGAKRRIIILGSTGSIGTQAIAVVRHLNALHDRGEMEFGYQVVGLAAGTSATALFAQTAAMSVKHVALAGGRAGGVPGGLADAADTPKGVAVFTGIDAAERLVREVDCDLVLAAMVGAAGLPATLAAAELGRDIALANKETLVAAGCLVIPAAIKSGSRVLPVDSEHCGVWQCLCGGAGRTNSIAAKPDACPPMRCGNEVTRVTLTASGGPFRTWTKAQMAQATVAQAMKHPTWTMGQKVTIDSASLMNKALELIEAHWLFGLGAERLHAVIHPQSIVHAMVEFADRTVMAQMATPDMQTAIQAALAWPRVVAGCGARFDWSAMSGLTFEPVDPERFPAVALAYQAIERGGGAGAVLNGANEAAVEGFVEGRIGFLRIAELVGRALEEVESGEVCDLEGCLRADAQGRAWVRKAIMSMPSHAGR